MEEKTKQRLIGILVLIGALFIILPFLFHNSRPSLNASTTVANSATPAVSVSLPADSATTANTASNTATSTATSTAISTTENTADNTTPAAQAPATPAAATTATPAPTPAVTAPAPTAAQPATQPTAQSTASTDGFVPDQAVSPSSGLTTGQHTGSLAPDPTLQATIQTQQASLAETSGVAHVAATAPAAKPKPVSKKIAEHHVVKTVAKTHMVEKTHAVAMHHNNGWHVQLAAFSDRKNAEALMKKLRTHHFDAYTHEIIHDHRHLTVVMVGPEVNEHSAMMVQHRLRSEFHLNGVVRKLTA